MDLTLFKIGLCITFICIVLFMIFVTVMKKKQYIEDNNFLENKAEIKIEAKKEKAVNLKTNDAMQYNTTSTNTQLVASITAAVCAYLGVKPENIIIKILDSQSKNDLCVRTFKRR